MSLTSYRAAPPRVNYEQAFACVLEVRFNLPESRDHQMKGPLARPMIPFGGPKYRREKICLDPALFGPDVS